MLPATRPCPNAVRPRVSHVEHEAFEATERLALLSLIGAGTVCSVDSRCDSFDDALAETVNGLFKGELIHRRNAWRSLDLIGSPILRGLSALVSVAFVDADLLRADQALEHEDRGEFRPKRVPELIWVSDAHRHTNDLQQIL